jgi:menaquinone-dependent protoporphyrinogen oxidase
VSEQQTPTAGPRQGGCAARSWTDAIAGPTTPLEAAKGPVNKGPGGPSLDPAGLHERDGVMIVLVGYASEHGSTQDIAQRVATTLDKAGNRVETQPLDRVRDVGRYDAVVLGSAIHDQQWLPPATRFVRRNRDVLVGLPVWLFSVGMPGALPRPLRRLARKEEQTVITNLGDAINPRDHRLFSGVIVPSQLSRMGRVIFRVLGCRYGDFRDWRAIDAWAQDIARALAVAAEARYATPAEQ